MIHAGWAVLLDGSVYLLYQDMELAVRRAEQVCGTVVEVFTVGAR